MEKLKNDWLTDGLIDFEYKRYVLLAYLKNVQQAFNRVELYPSLGDLVNHYTNLVNLKRDQTEILDSFPKELQGIDKEKLALIYKRILDDNGVMKELEEIVNYAIPLMKNSLEEGKEIYEFVEKNCELEPVGLLPLYVDEGYLFINHTAGKDMDIYKYHVTKIHSSDTLFRGINTTFLERVRRSVGDTLESIKTKLAKRFVEMPNPAVFAINAKIHFPYVPTLVPVAQRLLVRHISIS